MRPKPFESLILQLKNILKEFKMSKQIKIE